MDCVAVFVQTAPGCPSFNFPSDVLTVPHLVAFPFNPNRFICLLIVVVPVGVELSIILDHLTIGLMLGGEVDVV